MTGAVGQGVQRPSDLARLSRHVDDEVVGRGGRESGIRVRILAVGADETRPRGDLARDPAGEAGHLVPVGQGVRGDRGAEPGGSTEDEDIGHASSRAR